MLNADTADQTQLAVANEVQKSAHAEPIDSYGWLGGQSTTRWREEMP